MKQIPLYIFDLDGTLAIIDHRLPFIRGEYKDWTNFYASCDKDIPNTSLLTIMDMLRKAGADVWIFTGRSEESWDKTVSWLVDNSSFLRHELETVLQMRRIGNNTPDHKLKKEWYHDMLIDDRERLIAVFEDRQRVVEMWRSLGITCFSVADGNF
jgi:acid phosphatase class B